jgi:Domain of unknown function (DUF4169)
MPEAAVIANLNQYREKRRHTKAEREAAENQVRFGRTREERSGELRDNERAQKEIEGKRLD